MSSHINTHELVIIEDHISNKVFYRNLIAFFVFIVHDMNYKKHLKIGGIFALFHLFMGIGYLAIFIFLFY
ncbi:MAG: hypothetical protein GF383_08685 [Candidatus Lokiarchaeota archaeon]|nr:hypothetical protein [Candidatus Lokiarchaeota archaeon]MBD3340455.1 hypothetical protein [Candidatus Lokiarchaeota archaeon]